MVKAAATWTGRWWTLGGGGTVWNAIVYDADFNQLIIGVGNGTPRNQQLRSPGGDDNWFLSSIVALDAATGAYKWHYQTTPGDTWDYTATQPIVLAEPSIDEKRRNTRSAG
jgi:quinohemoprotein ethanol dehydrogenase